MKLNVAERLVLLNLLPREGGITTLRIVRELRDNLSFSEEEHKTLQFKSEDNGTQWESDAIGETEIEIGPRAYTLIAEILEKLDKDEKLVEDYMSGWEKFVEHPALQEVARV